MGMKMTMPMFDVTDISFKELSMALMGNYVTNQEEEYTKFELKETVNKLLDTLSEREKNVLIKRFGLDDNEPCSLRKIGKQYGVSFERIRQIEAKALRKMRNPSRARKLWLFAGREHLLEILEKRQKEQRCKDGDSDET